MDAPFYDRVIYSQSGDISVHLMFLDTTLLLRTKKKQNDEQLLWLAKSLAQSNSTIRLVVGFHTPFSDPVLSAFLVPVLESGDQPATAYFSGRERSMQWYKSKGGAHYFISGAGAEILKNENPFKTPSYVSPTSGFLACSVGLRDTGEPRLKVAFISNTGEAWKTVDTTMT
jgi:hypothetical protein